MRFLTLLSALFLYFSGTSAFAAASSCSSQKCTEIREFVDNACHGQGGGLVYVPVDASDLSNFCWCKCSCVTGDAIIGMADGTLQTIKTIKSGQKVLAMNNEGVWQEARVLRNDGTGSSQSITTDAIFTHLENGIQIITTSDHLFLLSDGSLRRADRLAPGVNLMLADNAGEVAVKVVGRGRYTGTMWNLTVSNEIPSMDGHLISTDGVVSADLVLQRAKTNSLKVGLEVGTKAHKDKYGAPMLTKPRRAFFGLGRTVFDEVDELIFDEEEGIKFELYKDLEELPEEAHHILPPDQDEAAEGTLYSLSNPVPFELAEYLVDHYKRFYPNISYEIDWYNNDVNAVAFRRGDKKYVRLYGGLIRHRFMDIEGVGLVLSHEIGHHYGGNPRYPSSWASCEGQSDYWGASVAQRKVWWGKYSIEQTSKGAEQLKRVFQFGLKNAEENDKKRLSATCSHPPAQCRFDTYMAGVTGSPKPSCAGN